MGAGQHADLRQDRAHGAHVAAVDADAGVEDVVAHNLRLQVMEDLADELLVELGFLTLGEDRGHGLGLHGVDGGVALLLDGLLVGVAQFDFGDGAQRRLDFGLDGQHQLAGLLGGLLREADDGVNHGLEAAMAGHDGFEHGLFGKLLGFRLDHQHGVGGAGHDELEGRILHLVDGGVQLQRAIDVADAGGAHGAHEGDAGDGQGGGDGDHGQDVRIVLEVMGQNGHDHLGVVAIALGEEGADRTVDQAGDQRLTLGGTTLALEIATGNAAGREGLFLIVHGEGEEVHADFRLLGGDDGGQHGGFTIARPHGAVGLTGHPARFEDQLAPGPVEFFTMDFEHIIHLS